MIRLHLFLLLLCSVPAFAQYRYDNVSYRTVFPQDLCRELEKNPGYVLLDVRTAGEYADTSSYGALNIGHLDGAINV
ncbi:MAG: rhodanese-like domain-containing protein, partial [Sphingobacteriaceae bacterium]